MDRIEGLPEGYRLGTCLGVHDSYRDSIQHPKQAISFELVPVEQPKELEVGDAEAEVLKALKVLVDEYGPYVENMTKVDRAMWMAAKAAIAKAEAIREKGPK